MKISEWLSRFKSEWLAILGALMSVVAAILSFGLFSFFEKPISPLPSDQPTSIPVDQRLQEITQRIDQLAAQLESLAKMPPEANANIKLQAMDTTLTDLKTRQSKIEEVILSNPAKAIELPLLRKDLDSLKDAQQQGVTAIKQGVDQVYDLNKWLLGAMAVSIVTLAISNLIKSREKENSTPH